MADQRPAQRNWLPEVIIAIRESGGRAGLAQIYRYVELHRRDLPGEYQSAVRATIYQHSTDAGGYVPGNPDVFYKVARGVWGLRHLDETLSGRSRVGLMSLALSQMTVEEFRPFADRPDAFRQELDRRVADLERRYGMHPGSG